MKSDKNKLTSGQTRVTRAGAMVIRRTVILDTAEALIRRDRTTNFSMRELAEEAGFSTATTYNLIGSKATVLYGLLFRSMDHLFREVAESPNRDDPVERLIWSGKIAVRRFIDDAALLKPLFLYLLGVVDSDNRPAYMLRVYDYWYQAAEEIHESGLLEPEITASDLARFLQIFAIGVLELWIHDEISDSQFEAQIEQGLTLHVLMMVPAQKRSAFVVRLSDVRAVVGPLYERVGDSEQAAMLRSRRTPRSALPKSMASKRKSAGAQPKNASLSGRSGPIR